MDATGSEMAVVMGLAVVALTVAATAAEAQTATRGNWDPAEGTGNVVLDGSSYHQVFQGEGDIAGWQFSDGSDISGETLSGVSGGGATGEQLDLGSSIPRTQPRGRYGGGATGATATVSTPRITALDVYNANGVKLGSSSSVSDDATLLVRAQWNFEEAEDVELVLRTPGGLNLEREALTTGPTAAQRAILPSGFDEDDLDESQQGLGSTGTDAAFWLLDLAELDSGSHSIVVSGIDDLDFGEARRSVTLSVGTRNRAYISTSRGSVTRGERMPFAVRSSEAGLFHAVAVERSDLRQNADVSRVFRLAGDTVGTGSTSQYAYAVVEIDEDGIGQGLLDTAQLDTGGVEVHLFEGRQSVSGAVAALGATQSINRGRLTVERAAVTIRSLPIRYVVGDEVTLSGTASGGVDAVAMYARDGSGSWQIVPLNGRRTTSVGSDGRWEARDVVLSEEEYGGRLFRFPGSYQFAIVDAGDLASPPPTRLTSVELSRTSHTRAAVSAGLPGITSSFQTIGGQVAVGDRLGFRGTSVGSDTVVIALIGDRGHVTADTHRARSGSAFIDMELDTDRLQRGGVTALALAPGRDGEFGDGSATDGSGATVSTRTPADFRDFVRSFHDTGRTGEQILSRVRGQSVGERGSDDLVVTRRFQMASPRTTIADLVPQAHRARTGVVPLEVGETAVVRGVTNRNPADAQISVEVTDGPSANAVDGATVRSWDHGTGAWTATLAFRDVRPGPYTVRADDGSSSDAVDIQVFAQGERPDEALVDSPTLRERLLTLRRELDRLENESRRQEDEIDALREERRRLRRNLSDRDGAGGDGGDGDGTPLPGFGVLAAAGALGLVALSAARRCRGKD